MWKILKVVSKGEYNYVKVDNHPNATVNGYVLHHRVVLENHLGRLLESHEVVHHLNGEKKDNRVENLQVLTIVEHSRLHGLEQGRQMVELKCPCCSEVFVRRRKQTHLSKPSKWTACSPACRGRFSATIQHHGRTAKVESAISGNIVREFTSYDNREETL